MASHYEMHVHVKSIFIHYFIRLRPINLSTYVCLTTPYDLHVILAHTIIMDYKIILAIEMNYSKCLLNTYFVAFDFSKFF